MQVIIIWLTWRGKNDVSILLDVNQIGINQVFWKVKLLTSWNKRAKRITSQYLICFYFISFRTYCLTLSLWLFVPIGNGSWQVLYTSFDVHTQLVTESFCWSANTSIWVHRKMLLMSLSLLLRLYLISLVRLTWKVWKMGGKWPHSLCFVGCCFQDLFKTASFAFSVGVSLKYKWCIHEVVLTWLQCVRILVFILFYQKDQLFL